MLFWRNRHLLALLAALVLMAHSTAATTNDIQTSKRFPPVKAGKVIGTKVENAEGQELGRLRDIVLDMHTGKVQHVIVASGGFLGIRTRVRPVPPELVSAGTAKRNTVALTFPRAQWEQAPTISRSGIAALGNPEHSRKIKEFYRNAAPHTAVASAHRSDANASARSLTPVGHASGEYRAGAKPAATRLASDIIGRHVVNREGERLGEVNDLLIGFDSDSPAFAIITTGRLFESGQRRYAVPVRAFSLEKKRRLTVDASADLLARARPFTENTWQEATLSGTPEIFRY